MRPALLPQTSFVCTIHKRAQNTRDPAGACRSLRATWRLEVAPRFGHRRAAKLTQTTIVMAPAKSHFLLGQATLRTVRRRIPFWHF